MSDRDRQAPRTDWVDTTAGNDPDRPGGTGDVEDVDTGTGATTTFAPDDGATGQNRPDDADLDPSRRGGVSR